ncbi:hypothetical protein TELCIR_13224, partial [Teladorsagia circumcincta]
MLVDDQRTPEESCKSQLPTFVNPGKPRAGVHVPNQRGAIFLPSIARPPRGKNPAWDVAELDLSDDASSPAQKPTSRRKCKNTELNIKYVQESLKMRLLLLFTLLFAAVHADWWDSFTDTIASGLTSMASWVKETASPAIRTTFNDAKEKLQDPETHRVIQDWVSEKAGDVKEFAEKEVVPELKKVYDAAKAAATSRSVD